MNTDYYYYYYFYRFFFFSIVLIDFLFLVIIRNTFQWTVSVIASFYCAFLYIIIYIYIYIYIFLYSGKCRKHKENEGQNILKALTYSQL